MPGQPEVVIAGEVQELAAADARASAGDALMMLEERTADSEACCAVGHDAQLLIARVQVEAGELLGYVHGARFAHAAHRRRRRIRLSKTPLQALLNQFFLDRSSEARQRLTAH